MRWLILTVALFSVACGGGGDDGGGSKPRPDGSSNDNDGSVAVDGTVADNDSGTTPDGSAEPDGSGPEVDANGVALQAQYCSDSCAWVPDCVEGEQDPNCVPGCEATIARSGCSIDDLNTLIGCYDMACEQFEAVDACIQGVACLNPE